MSTQNFVHCIKFISKVSYFSLTALNVSNAKVKQHVKDSDDKANDGHKEIILTEVPSQIFFVTLK